MDAHGTVRRTIHLTLSLDGSTYETVMDDHDSVMRPGIPREYAIPALRLTGWRSILSRDWDTTFVRDRRTARQQDTADGV